jgi:hypothetical protein
MSRFYGTIEGSAKTLATRRGHTNICSHTRGWNAGVQVDGYSRGDSDVFDVSVTQGSSYLTGNPQFALRVETDNKGGKVVCTFQHPETGEQITFTV